MEVSGVFNSCDTFAENSRLKFSRSSFSVTSVMITTAPACSDGKTAKQESAKKRVQRRCRVTFINAGHNLPFVQKADGEFQMITAKANMVLGMMEDVPYREQYLELSKGDCIYLYTDGVTEALNPKQELLGDANLTSMLNRHREMAGDADAFVDAMYDEVDAFADGEMQADDITMVYLSRK